MFLQVFTIDEDVIHVDRYFFLCYEVHEYRVHEGLEGRWTVGHSKVQDLWFVQSSISDYCSLPFVSFVYANVMIAPPDVELSEILCLCQPVDDVCCQRKWIPILNGDLIKSSVILNKS